MLAGPLSPEVRLDSPSRRATTPRRWRSPRWRAGRSGAWRNRHGRCATAFRGRRARSCCSSTRAARLRRRPRRCSCPPPCARSAAGRARGGRCRALALLASAIVPWMLLERLLRAGASAARWRASCSTSPRTTGPTSRSARTRGRLAGRRAPRGAACGACAGGCRRACAAALAAVASRCLFLCVAWLADRLLRFHARDAGGQRLRVAHDVIILLGGAPALRASARGRRARALLAARSRARPLSVALAPPGGLRATRFARVDSADIEHSGAGRAGRAPARARARARHAPLRAAEPALLPAVLHGPPDPEHRAGAPRVPPGAHGGSRGSSRRGRAPRDGQSRPPVQPAAVRRCSSEAGVQLSDEESSAWTERLRTRLRREELAAEVAEPAPAGWKERFRTGSGCVLDAQRRAHRRSRPRHRLLARQPGDVPRLRGARLRDEFWPPFFYRFVGPDERRGAGLNYARSPLQGAAPTSLPCNWVVLPLPAAHHVERRQ